MINPCLIDKEIIDRLKEKSKTCFGTLWKFRTLADKAGLSHEEIEEQMDAIITYKETNANGRNQHTPTSRHYTRKQRRLIQRHFAKQQRKEIRSGQTKLHGNIDDTAGGTE